MHSASKLATTTHSSFLTTSKKMMYKLIHHRGAQVRTEWLLLLKLRPTHVFSPNADCRIDSKVKISIPDIIANWTTSLSLDSTSQAWANLTIITYRLPTHHHLSIKADRESEQEQTNTPGEMQRLALSPSKTCIRYTSLNPIRRLRWTLAFASADQAKSTAAIRLAQDRKALPTCHTRPSTQLLKRAVMQPFVSRKKTGQSWTWAQSTHSL